MCGTAFVDRSWVLKIPLGRGGEAIISTDDLPVGVRVPKGSRLHAIEREYGPLPESIRCGKEDCGTPHKRGFVVTFADPQGTAGRAIVGHICGKKQFGQIWVEAKARHTAEVNKARVLEEAGDFLQVAEDVEPRLQKLLPGLEARQAIRHALAVDAPIFMRACETACRGSGYIEGHRSDGVRVRLHEVEGRLFFLQDLALKRVKVALNSIASMRLILDEGQAPIKVVGELIRRLSDLRHTTETVEREAADGRTGGPAARACAEAPYGHRQLRAWPG